MRDGFDVELDELRRTRQGGTELVVALESSLRAETGVPGLRVRYTRVFGWYIEVTRSQLGKVPASWRRKQTVAGGERYTNTELDELAERIESAEERSLAREQEILERLLSAVVAEADAIRHLARTLGLGRGVLPAYVAHRPTTAARSTPAKHLIEAGGTRWIGWRRGRSCPTTRPGSGGERLG